MELTAKMEAALDKWVGHETWNTRHPLDLKRWFGFVAAVRADQGCIEDESWLNEEIVRRVEKRHGPLNTDYVRETVAKRVDLAVSILDYLEHVEPRGSL